MGRKPSSSPYNPKVVGSPVATTAARARGFKPSPQGRAQDARANPAVDKENPETWKKFFKDSCKACRATCCTMPIEIRWEDLVALNLLSDDELIMPLKAVVVKLKKEKIITAYRKESGLFALKQTEDGKCRYLIANKCGVYKNRPLVCRAFPLTMGWRHGFCPQQPKIR